VLILWQIDGTTQWPGTDFGVPTQRYSEYTVLQMWTLLLNSRVRIWSFLSNQLVAMDYKPWDNVCYFRSGYLHGNGYCWLLCFLSNEVVAMEYTTMREVNKWIVSQLQNSQLAASLRKKTSKHGSEARYRRAKLIVRKDCNNDSWSRKSNSVTNRVVYSVT
jgi:hypothetical protein